MVSLGLGAVRLRGDVRSRRRVCIGNGSDFGWRLRLWLIFSHSRSAAYLRSAIKSSGARPNLQQHLLSVAKASLAQSPLPEPCPTNVEMGQAALDFVQRFDLQAVLGEFERELRLLAGEVPRIPAVRVVPCAKLD